MRRSLLTATLLAGIPLAITLMEIPVVVLGLLFRRRASNIGLNSVVLMSLLIGAALYFARAQSWVRFAAWQFLAGVVLNAIAAPLLFVLRGRIARLESTFGGFTSEL